MVVSTTEPSLDGISSRANRADEATSGLDITSRLAEFVALGLRVGVLGGAVAALLTAEAEFGCARLEVAAGYCVPVLGIVAGFDVTGYC